VAVGRTLVRIGDARAIPSLISALLDQDWSVRKTAAQELVRLYTSGSLDSHNAELIHVHVQEAARKRSRA